LCFAILFLKKVALCPKINRGYHRMMISLDKFPEEKLNAIYDAIFKRRDVRKFRKADLSDEVLYRLIKAAHHAPSVGFMQPWNFLVVRDLVTRGRVKESFIAANKAAHEMLDGERKEKYSALKLEGIMESSLNICFTCDPTRSGPFVLGRTSIPETDVYSVCCAVENFWLAARAEGLGAGWVSILDNAKLKEILAIPDHVVPVAYLCVGVPEEFYAEPELQTSGWRARLPMEELIFHEKWGKNGG
jgi:5,6-dimethylbenzimidazole synthase